MKVAKREIWSTFWIYISDWNRSEARFFSWTSWIYQPPLSGFWDIPLTCSFRVLQYCYQEITLSWSIFIMPTPHSLNWFAKQCMLLEGWRGNDLNWTLKKQFGKHQSIKRGEGNFKILPNRLIWNQKYCDKKNFWLIHVNKQLKELPFISPLHFTVDPGNRLTYLVGSQRKTRSMIKWENTYPGTTLTC